MDWNVIINRMVTYIETHLHKDIDIQDLTGISHYSEFHTQKLFHIASGFTLKEYLRKRRLSEAAIHLQRTTERITDIALEYGYENNESFSRAFRQYHGCSPSEARSGAIVNYFPAIKLNLQITGGMTMEYRIEERGIIRIIGVKETYADFDEGIKKIPLFWNCFNGSETETELCALADKELIYGICLGEKGTTAYDYVIGVESCRDGSKYEVVEIAASRWLVFAARGKLPESVQKVTREIFEHFLPNADFTIRELPEMEVYPPGDTDSADYVTEIWIPIQ